MSDHDSMGPQRRNAPRGISFHRHSAKKREIRAQWLERRRPSNFRAATRVGATAKAPSDIVELWTTHARKQFEMLSEQTKELTALGQKMAGESAEPITRSINHAFKKAS